MRVDFDADSMMLNGVSFYSTLSSKSKRISSFIHEYSGESP